MPDTKSEKFNKRYNVETLLIIYLSSVFIVYYYCHCSGTDNE